MQINRERKQRLFREEHREASEQPVENQRTWVGALRNFAEGIITLEPSPGKSVQFPLELVERANLKFEW